MKIFAISDLHLSFGTNKPMNIFGNNWNDYEKKIKEDWISKVTDEDIVIIAGDFSWGTYMKDSLEDFKYINSLPGKKILLKGNHDYWWETVTKLNNFLKENDMDNIYFLHNNFFETSEYFICGTRYWTYDALYENDKIFRRELERVKLSIDMAKNKDESKPIILVTHYPPDERIINEVKGNNVKIWIYGHIHSNYEEMEVNIPDIKTYLTSCDYLNFKLLQIAEFT